MSEILTKPAKGAYAVTPHDSTALTAPARMITINVSGTLSYIGWDGVTYTTGALPVGSYPVFATHVRSTGTTATGITAWS